nr:erythromycin esterase family protein [Paenibacillus hamazuiensis]
MEAIGEAKYVLLGEASHGTSEFYKVRAKLTQRLIKEKGFSFIAVEGDWPPCYSVNGYIKREGPSAEAESAKALLSEQYRRWPAWMWANEEIAALAEWLREENSSRPDGRKVGFYGLDVYSLWESMDEIIRYLEKEGSEDLQKAKMAFECFEPYRRDEQSYGISAAFLRDTCEEDVIGLLKAMQDKRKAAQPGEKEDALSAELNALVAVNAEKYYRAMVQGGPQSWNVRDRHMAEVLEKLMQFHGPDAKAIVWEHNTHVGDARFTDMKEDGMVNIGQLVREKSDSVFIVGFGTYQGTVIAGKEWGAPHEVINVPESQPGSWEDLMHRAGQGDRLLLFTRGASSPIYRTVLGHRAIGVVYRPEHERWGNYVPTSLSQRYDAFIFIDRTHALNPLVREAQPV